MPVKKAVQKKSSTSSVPCSMKLSLNVYRIDMCMAMLQKVVPENEIEAQKEVIDTLNKTKDSILADLNLFKTILKIQNTVSYLNKQAKPNYSIRCDKCGKRYRMKKWYIKHTQTCCKLSS